MPREARQAPKTLREARQIAERQFLLEIGEQCGWNRAKMARTLKIDRKSLYRHMLQLDMLAAHPAMSAPWRRAASKATPALKAGRRRRQRSQSEPRISNVVTARPAPRMTGT